MSTITRQDEVLTNIRKIVSHDLKAHSSNVMLLIEALKLSHNFSDEDELLSMLTKSANSVSKTIENIYKILNTHTNRNIQKEKIDLNDLVSEIEHDIEIKQLDNLIIVNEIEAGTVLHSVEAYLNQSLTGLIHNAFQRSNDEELSVVIQAEVRTDEIIITVTDNGKGFNLNLNQNNVFNMYHGSNPEGKSIDIDLFLVKNQIEALGGSIFVDSEQDKKTIFKIHLPHE